MKEVKPVTVSFSKVLQNSFKVIYHDQTTIEISTFTAIHIFSPNLDGEGRGNFTNSETIKAVALVFCWYSVTFH